MASRSRHTSSRTSRSTYAGQQVAHFIWTSGISRDPVVTFTLVADREGPLTMRWVDNKGAVFEQTAQIAFSTT